MGGARPNAMRPVEEELAIAVGDLSVLVDGDLIGWGDGNSIPARSAERQRTWFSVGGSLGCAWLRPCRGREYAVFEASLSLTVPAVRASPAGLLSGLGGCRRLVAAGDGLHAVNQDEQIRRSSAQQFIDLRQRHRFKLAARDQALHVACGHLQDFGCLVIGQKTEETERREWSS